MRQTATCYAGCLAEYDCLQLMWQRPAPCTLAAWVIRAITSTGDLFDIPCEIGDLLDVNSQLFSTMGNMQSAVQANPNTFVGP